MVAQVCDLEVGELIFTGGDVHLYMDHMDQIKTQLERNPKPLPTLQLNKDIKDIDEFGFDDIVLLNYESHPAIKAPISV